MKKRQLLKKFSRLEDQMKILIHNPKFKDDISDLRKKWSIPSEGLKTNDGWKKWQHWLENESEIFMKKKLVKSKNKFKNVAEIPINAFNIDLDNLLKKYKLSPNLKISLWRYLLSDDINDMHLRSGLSIDLKYDDKDGTLKEIKLNIGANTTLEDIKAIWGEVNLYQKHLPYKRQEKLQPRPNLDRDLRLFNLKEEGKSTDEIVKILQNEYGINSMSYDDINKIIQRIKKRMDTN